MGRSSFFYVIAYDIADDKRRRKIHNLLCGYCMWTQYSLFEGHLGDKDRIALEAKLRNIVDEQHDSVRFYPLCATDVDNVVTIGSEMPQEDKEFIV